MKPIDESRPLSPRFALAALTESSELTRKATEQSPPGTYVLWGTVYGLGFLTLHGAAFGWLPFTPGAALLVFALLTLVGAVLSAVLGYRRTRAVRGRSSRQGLQLGIAWTASMLTLGFFGIALSRAGVDAIVLYWLVAAVATLVIAILMMSAGSLRGSPPEFAVGIALIVVNIGALLVGPSPLILLPWLTSAGTLFGGAIVAARRGSDTR